MRNLVKCLSRTAQQVNLPACSPHCPFNAERRAGLSIPKSLIFYDIAIGVGGLGFDSRVSQVRHSVANEDLIWFVSNRMKPKFTAPKSDALSNRPSERMYVKSK